MADVCLSLGVLLNCTCSYDTWLWPALSTSGCTAQQNELLLETLAATPAVKNATCIHVSFVKSTFNGFPDRLKQLSSSVCSLTLTTNPMSLLERLDYTMEKLEVLILTNNSIREIGTGFLMSFPALKHLDISHNRLVELNAPVFRSNGTVTVLKNLQRFLASQNSIHQIGDGFLANLACLTDLDLSHNDLTSFHTKILFNGSDFVTLEQLTFLKLESNEISHFGFGIFARFPKLRSLDISHNNLVQVDTDMITINNHTEQMIYLTKLDIKNNTLSHIGPEFLSAFPNLQQLDLSHNSLEYLDTDIISVDNNITSFGNLYEAWFDHNKFSNISHGFLSAFPRLARLDLNDNQLTSLDVGMLSPTSQATTLEWANSVRLQNNNISRIEPGFFSAFPNIQNLFLDHNCITSLVAEIVHARNRTKTLKSLTRLTLDHNHIDHIGSGFFSVFPRITTVDLSHNSLKHLDPEVFTLTGVMSKLAFVYLDHNRITHIAPGFFALLPNLQYFNLSRNQLTVLDLDMIHFANQTVTLNRLTAVDFHYNHIRSIGRRFLTAFSNLQKLDLSNNRLQYLDVGILNQGKQLDRLYWLNLSNNEISFIDPLLLSRLPALATLDVACNHLTTLSITMVTQLAFLFLQDNMLTYFNLQRSHHMIGKKDTGDAPMQILDLSNNSLTALPKGLQMLQVKQLRLHANPWYCDCHLQWMKTWMTPNANAEEKETTVCRAPFFNSSFLLASLEDRRFVCDDTVAGLAGAVVSSLLLIVSSVLLYKWRYEWKFYLFHKYGFHPFDKDECENEEKRFDVFVSYSNDDSEFAQELIDDLEGDGFRVCHHKQDFHPGTRISENVERAVHYSKRTLCIVSRAFMDSNFCMHEFITARSFDFSYKKKRLIVILSQDIPAAELHEDIRLYIKSFTYLKRSCVFFRKRLLYVLPQRKIGELLGEHQPLLTR